MNYRVFLSYSRTDQRFVEPVKKLLDGVDRLSFFDRADIVAGSRWAKSITDAIQQVEFFVLFWCAHSCRSRPVRDEYVLALESRKKIIPILLDSAKLPSPLAEFQWVDFREWSNGPRHFVDDPAGRTMVTVERQEDAISRRVFMEERRLPSSYPESPPTDEVKILSLPLKRRFSFILRPQQRLLADQISLRLLQELYLGPPTTPLIADVIDVTAPRGHISPPVQHRRHGPRKR